MKSIILYYSYTGNCKKQALKLQSEMEDAKLYEIKDRKRVNMFITFMINCPKAALRKSVPIKEITVDLKQFDRIIMIAPIWNNHPAPEFNEMIKALPQNKEVELYMCSGGGETEKSKKGTCELIKKAGCKLIAYYDVQTVGMLSK